jgi:lysophospholipid acyltransferase (LPLAT)-like uncharacterized protein
MFRRFLLPRLIWWFYRIWIRTWRFEVHESPELKVLLENNAPIVFAHWHGDEAAITHLVTRYRIATMTSTSRDGDLIDFVIRKLGGATSRGSDTRGAVGGLKGLVSLMSKGFRASMAVDGPRGPIHVVKPGVFQLSRLAKAHIVPTGVAISSGFVLEKSWNKASLPRPFARVIVVLGHPVRVVTKADDARSPELTSSLAAHLADARHYAAKLLADLR